MGSEILLLLFQLENFTKNWNFKLREKNKFYLVTDENPQRHIDHNEKH